MKLHGSIIVAALVTLSTFVPLTATAAPAKYNMSGKVTGGNGYTVMLVQKTGATKSVTLGSSGNFSFKKLTLAQLKGASLELIDPDGRYAGPVVLGKKGSKVSVSFSGKAKTAAAFVLGKINLKAGYAAVKGKVDATAYARPLVAAVSGKPVGAGEHGLVETASANVMRVRAASTPAGPDDDHDGIRNEFDADDDGDLVLDGSDLDSEGLDVPYSSLVFDFRRTLNSQVRTGLNDDVIDAAVGGENVFALTFFFSLPSQSTVNSGHVICDDSLVYCRRNTPLGYYGGVSESSSEFREKPWSELLTSAGYPRMEQINLSGGAAMVASIQPRVGRDQFRVGDVYQVVLTSGSTTVSTRSLALTPYFVSVPAIKEYDAGSGTVTVDYASVTAESGSIPGVSPSDPIILSDAGNLALTYWRPQREALRSDEAGYYDWGNLNYGLVIEELQATCGGYYTGVSTELSADETPLGTGDSPLANQGANLVPYRDISGDRAASAENTLAFTVNLKDCLARAGGSPGGYWVVLTAAGENLTGGYNSATQRIYVQIP